MSRPETDLNVEYVLQTAKENGAAWISQAQLERLLARLRDAEEALRKLADEEAWSMRNKDMERYGMGHGPWYFDPETDDGDEPPWKIAQDALIDDFSDDPQAHLQGRGGVRGNTP